MGMPEGEARKFRCPSCGGLNPAGAEWCGQCMRRFAAPPPPPAAAPNVASSGTSTAEDTSGERASYVDASALGLDTWGRPLDDGPLRAQTETDRQTTAMAPPPAAAVGTERGAFKVTEQGIVWRCARCESENAVEASVCSTCGASIADTLRPPEPERPQRDPNTVALISLFFPGAGHAYIGMWGQAVARASISIWVVFTALMGAVQKDIKGGMLLAAVFGLAAFALWALAAHDAYREARRERSLVILQGRRFLYTVMGLLGLLFVLLVGTALSARG